MLSRHSLQSFVLFPGATVLAARGAGSPMIIGQLDENYTRQGLQFTNRVPPCESGSSSVPGESAAGISRDSVPLRRASSDKFC